MEKFITRTVWFAAVCLIATGLVVPVTAQTVNITFTVNTATNLDTLGESGVVQLRGALLAGDGETTREGDILPGGGNISWSANSSLVLQNIGGDYWQGTFEMEANDTLGYKVWTGFDLENGTIPDGGWEGAFNPSNGLTRDTRIFISGDTDSTLDVQYYHPNLGDGAMVDQFFRPFESKEDTLALYFRVNMGGLQEAGEFDPDTEGPVGMRGNDQTSGGTFDWGATDVLLTREENSVDGGSFWSGTAYVDVDSVTAGTNQAYKFYMENVTRSGWEEGISDRMLPYTPTLIASGDTTVHWVYFENRGPVGMAPVAATITFRVSTEALEGLDLFDRGLGDQIAVIGAKGWDINPQDNDFLEMNFIPALQEWTISEPFEMIPGTELNYKYFVRWDPSRVDENSPNFIPNLKIRFINDDDESSGWEEPAVTGGGNRVYTYTPETQQNPEGDFGFDRAFFNSVPPQGVFNTDLTVTWQVDMTPAASAATNTNTHLFNPASDSVWIRWDGSLLALAKGFETFGERDILLEDEDDDMIYTTDYLITAPGWYQLPFIIEYGNITDGYVTNGGGTTLGRRYYQYISPTQVNEDGTTDWPATFTLPVIEWVENNLPFQQPPNLTLPTSVADEDFLPVTFDLQQNFPNPFNPETNIRFRVATASDVEIKIYNAIGQLVRTLVDQRMAPAEYTITWRGEDNRGRPVSSGVYFMKMKAADFTQVRKMALVR